MKTGFPDSENVDKSCKIEHLEVETGDMLTKMEASITMLRRLQSFCVQQNAKCLTMAHALGFCWFPGLPDPPGFKLCNCKRVLEQGIHYCMALPTPSIEAPIRINEEPFRRNAINRTVATTNTEIRTNAMASENGEDAIPMVAPGLGLVRTPKPSEQSVGQPEQKSEAPVEISVLRNPPPHRHQGTGMSRPASQEANDTEDMIMQGLTDDTAEKATAYGTIAIRSRPAAKIANQKKYCSHWMRTGECDYMQTGCKYKHEMPVDKETLRNCGFREIPRWFVESPEFEDYLEKTGELGIGRLTGVSAEENVTSTAESYRRSLDRRGESVGRLQGAGRTLLTPTPWRDEGQLVSHRVRSPYDNDHQRIVTPKPDAKGTRAGPSSAADTNVTDRAAFRQLEMQPYKPAGAMASSNDLSVRGAAGESSKIKEEDVEHLPRRQARNNGGSGMAAGTPALRQFQQALGGSRPAGNSAGSTMGAGKTRQRSSLDPDVDDQSQRRGGKGAKTGRNE